MAPVHGRMPVIVAPEDYGLWLNPAVQARGPLETILRPYPAERMEGWPVRRRVNNGREDDAGLIVRASAD